MTNRSGSCFSFRLLAAAALVLAPAQFYPAQGSGCGQAEALADLTAAILTCSIHPCLGESQKDVRKTLRGAIVTDGVFYFSDLAEAYPTIRGKLHGLVEWSFSGGLETISMKITGFRVAPSLLSAELERTLPGFQSDGDVDKVPAQTMADGDEGIPQNEWSCSATGKGDEEVGIDVDFAPGLLIYGIGP